MVKTNRRKYSKRSYKRNSIKRKRSYKNNHRGGSFLMAHIPTIILGLMDVGAIIFLSMYDTDSSGISTGSPPQVGVQAQQQIQPGQQQLSPAQQQLSPAQQQLSPAQQQLYQGKNESKEECEKRKKELSKGLKKMKQDIDTKKSAIRRLRIDETAKKKAATAAVADAETKEREAAEAVTRKEAAKVVAEGLKMANELDLANAAARAAAAAEEVAAARALALANARAGDGSGGGSAQKRGGSGLHKHENVEGFLSEETGDEVDSPEVEKLKYELEDLVSEYNELVEEYNKDCSNVGKEGSKGFVRRKKGEDKEEELKKKINVVKGFMYMKLRDMGCKTGQVCIVDIENYVNIIYGSEDEPSRKLLLGKVIEDLNQGIFTGNNAVLMEPFEEDGKLHEHRYKIENPKKLMPLLRRFEVATKSLEWMKGLFKGAVPQHLPQPPTQHRSQPPTQPLTQPPTQSPDTQHSISVYSYFRNLREGGNIDHTLESLKEWFNADKYKPTFDGLSDAHWQSLLKFAKGGEIDQGLPGNLKEELSQPPPSSSQSPTNTNRLVMRRIPADPHDQEWSTLRPGLDTSEHGRDLAEFAGAINGTFRADRSELDEHLGQG